MITNGFAPGLAFSVDPNGDQHFNPLELTAGRWPDGPHEIAIDANTASTKHYAVGQTDRRGRARAEQQYKITGIVKLGGVASIGGATIAIFDLPTAQGALRQGRASSTRSTSRRSPGSRRARCSSEIRPILPPATQVRSGAGQAAEAGRRHVASFTSIIQKFLLAFGGIALFVGIFVIANTLSITIAQRAREFGTLRTIGATRRQVLTVGDRRGRW